LSKVKIFLFWQFLFFSALPVLAQVDTGWVRRYNGPGNGWDQASALAVDDSGNVYATGFSGVIPSFDFDYATIKYAPNGNTLWVRRYNGPGNDYDVATALAVDDSGNVYVTGRSDGSGTFSDYATIKYAPNGDSLWVRRYNGPANNDDYASALAVDNSGNAYVTGASFGFGTDLDYVTIKYAPNGDTLWVRRYNGPGIISYDYASALAVDDSGNVYVTGYSVGSGTSEDYATIKYSPAGDTVWVRRYNGPGNFEDRANALAVDGSENVYVTGWSRDSGGTFYDYATLKYAPNGDTLWVRRYNGPGNSGDYASALAVDVSGNVYVTGWSYGSGTSYDYATIKYASNGDTLWVRRYNGPGNSDYAKALAVDDSGNVYVTGWSYGSQTLPDYATIKYAPNGDTLWVRRYDGPPGNLDDIPYALAVDGIGNVYVTGVSIGSGTSYDYATIKYNKFGCAAKAGDANSDYKVNLSDIIFKVNYVFKGGAKPDPLCSGDDNADNIVNLPDIIYSVNFVFKGGPAPLKSLECCL